MYFPSLYLIHKATKIPAELTPNPSSIVGGLGTSIVIGPYSLFNLSLPIPPWVIFQNGHMGSNDSDMFCPVPLGLSIPRLSLTSVLALSFWNILSMGDEQENNWHLGSICSDFEGPKWKRMRPRNSERITQNFAQTKCTNCLYGWFVLGLKQTSVSRRKIFSMISVFLPSSFIQ